MTFTLGIFVSFAIYIAVGLFVGRKIKSRADYYVANRNAPTILITGTLVASFISTVAFMGDAAFAYEGNLIPMAIQISFNISGYVLGVLFFGRYLRRSRSLTVPEYFGKRFDSPAMQAIAGATVVIGLGFYLLAVTQGVSLIVSTITGIDQFAILVIVGIAYIGFTLYGGSPGVIINDTIMFFVFMIAGVVGMGFIIMRAGGPSAVVQELSGSTDKAGIATWHGAVGGPDSAFATPTESIVWAVTLGLVWATIVAVGPWQSSRYLMARSEHVALRSAFWTTGALLVLYIFLLFGAASLNLINPSIDPSELMFIWAATDIMPTVLGVIAITGLVAAGLSSASTFLSLVGFSAAHDLAPYFGWGRGGTDRAALRFNRIVVLVVGIVVLGATYVAPPAIFTIAYFTGTLFAASWGPVAFMSVFSKRITTRGAIAGMVTGFVCAFVLKGSVDFLGLNLPTWADPVILSVLASIVAIFIGNATQLPKPKTLEVWESLGSAPAPERVAVEVRTTKRIAVGAGMLCVGCTVILLVGYWMPLGS